ncbi:6-phosphogluconolactonase [Irpex lacteus]|nr:6-phosphogluconolactonase [Irpex lacteus]
MTGHQPSAPVVNSFANPEELIESLAQFIIKAQKESIQKKGRFTVAVSGGSLPKQLNGLIGKDGVKWDKWQVFYADERIVPLDHEDSNHALNTTELWSKVPIPEANIHTIDPTLIEAASADDAEDALEEIADAYEQELIREFASKDSARFPIFDLILLGVGPDGHTCSLFPGHPLLSEDDRWVAYITDSPKPPPRRLTLTYPVLNHASRVAFVAAGAGKADTLHTVLDKPEEGLPASRVRPISPGQVYWFVDDAAAAKVEYPKTPFKL